MWKNPVLLIGLGLTLLVAIAGIVDTEGLGKIADNLVQTAFSTRGWFIMLVTSAITICSVFLVFSRYGQLKLGREDEQPEFSNLSWFTMMFAAGMGVGLLYWGAAEPLSHFLVAKNYMNDGKSVR